MFLDEIRNIRINRNDSFSLPGSSLTFPVRPATSDSVHQQNSKVNGLKNVYFYSMDNKDFSNFMQKPLQNNRSEDSNLRDMQVTDLGLKILADIDFNFEPETSNEQIILEIISGSVSNFISRVSGYDERKREQVINAFLKGVIMTFEPTVVIGYFSKILQNYNQDYSDFHRVEHFFKCLIQMVGKEPTNTGFKWLQALSGLQDFYITNLVACQEISMNSVGGLSLNYCYPEMSEYLTFEDYLKSSEKSHVKFIEHCTSFIGASLKHLRVEDFIDPKEADVSSYIAFVENYLLTSFYNHCFSQEIESNGKLNTSIVEKKVQKFVKFILKTYSIAKSKNNYEYCMMVITLFGKYEFGSILRCFDKNSALRDKVGKCLSNSKTILDYNRGFKPRVNCPNEYWPLLSLMNESERLEQSEDLYESSSSLVDENVTPLNLAKIYKKGRWWQKIYIKVLAACQCVHDVPDINYCSEEDLDKVIALLYNQSKKK